MASSPQANSSEANSIKTTSIGTNCIVEVRNLSKFYQKGTTQVRALDGIDCSIHQGEFIAIMGPSGSGKSTLLQLLGALDRPSQGEIVFQGAPLQNMNDYELSLFRRRNLGFIFQFFNLLPTMTALENVMLASLLDGDNSENKRQQAMDLLERLGLKERMDHFPSHLSGGQMQRVAIARALLAKPFLILADEPTGSLDSATGLEILKLLSQLVRDQKQTLVMVTHDESVAKWASRTIRIRDGKIEADTHSTSY